jgi:phosphatidylserine decarboxylase
MRIPLTGYGLREILAITALCTGLAVILVWAYTPLIALPVLIWVALLAFFRDPERACGGAPHELLSPADGTVADVEEVPSAVFLNGPALRVGIFMSILDVHVNRSPCAGRVAYVKHHPGKHHDARSRECELENEHNFVGLETPPGQKILVNQIAGMVARRIVCEAAVGTELARGERFGMVKFGSRLELYVPLSAKPESRVQVGQKVRAGEDVLIVRRALAEGGNLRLGEEA